MMVDTTTEGHCVEFSSSLSSTLACSKVNVPQVAGQKLKPFLIVIFRSYVFQRPRWSTVRCGISLQTRSTFNPASCD
jgi:hypothetical protein